MVLLKCRGMVNPPSWPAKNVFHRCSTGLADQLTFADWAGFGHYKCHDLASCLTGTLPLGYHNVVLDSRECNKATC
jgi:hypothetical protein